jgi:hypothetical protein
MHIEVGEKKASFHLHRGSDAGALEPKLLIRLEVFDCGSHDSFSLTTLSMKHAVSYALR